MAIKTLETRGKRQLSRGRTTWTCRSRVGGHCRRGHDGHGARSRAAECRARCAPRCLTDKRCPFPRRTATSRRALYQASAIAPTATREPDFDGAARASSAWSGAPVQLPMTSAPGVVRTARDPLTHAFTVPAATAGTGTGSHRCSRCSARSRDDEPSGRGRVAGRSGDPDVVVQAIADRDSSWSSVSRSAVFAPLVAAQAQVALIVPSTGWSRDLASATAWTATGHRSRTARTPTPRDVPARRPAELSADAADHAGPQATCHAGRGLCSCWPDVPTHPCPRDDRFFPAAWQREVVGDRLAIEPDEIDGGHCVALTAARARRRTARRSARTNSRRRRSARLTGKAAPVWLRRC